MASGTRLTASTFGVLAGIGGITHAVGEMQQGGVRPDGVFVASWSDGPIARAMDGDPAFVLVPNLLLAGLLTLIVSGVVVAWSANLLRRERGGATLAVLSFAMLLAGGGVGPPVIGMLAGWAASGIGRPPSGWITRVSPRARRALAAAWPWMFGAAAVDGLFLFVGSLALIVAFEVERADVFLGAFYLAAVLVGATTVAAFARETPEDRRAPARELRQGRPEGRLRL
jgi:hypothetical protein